MYLIVMGRHEDALARVAKSKNVKRGVGKKSDKGNTEYDHYKHGQATARAELLHKGVNAVVHHGTKAAVDHVKSYVPGLLHGRIDSVRRKVVGKVHDKVDDAFEGHKKAFGA